MPVEDLATSIQPPASDMSFKGKIEVRCPSGCEPFETEIWSFIRGDRDSELREAVASRECNLILCEHCDRPFFPEAPFVYFEPSREILAFVFPESYREKKEYWEEKMSRDFASMKESLGEGMPLSIEPEIFFGYAGLAELLRDEDYRGEEREVMEAVASEQGLSLYRISPKYARDHRIPSSLPYVSKDGHEPATVRRVVEGLERLLSANPHLAGYQKCLLDLKKAPSASLPPSHGRN